MQEPPITDFTSSVRYGHIQQNGQITFTDDLFRQRIKISHTPAPCLLCVARSSRAQPQAETLHDMSLSCGAVVRWSYTGPVGEAPISPASA